MRLPLPITSALIGLLVGCDPSGSTEDLGLPTPEWPSETPSAEAPDAELVARNDVGVAPLGERPDATSHTPYVPLVDRTVSLKEHFTTGERLRRELRVERSYRVRVHTGRTASAQGTTELIRHYTVDVHDALGGQIVAATVTIAAEGRRVVPGGDEWPRGVPEPPGLEGVSYECRLNPLASFDCDLPSREGEPIDVEGITIQRPGTHPGRPAAVGDTWELHGDEAVAFLGLPAGEVSVALTFDDAEAVFEHQVCHHVTYTFEGTQPLAFSGRHISAEVSGQGELYHCREPNAIVYHRQERDVTATQPHRPGGTPPLERVEHIVLEERTSVEQTRPTLAPVGGPP